MFGLAIWEMVLIYIGIKIILAGGTGLLLTSARKNISQYIEMLKQKPTSRKRLRTGSLNLRLKLTRIIAPAILIPGLGEMLFLSVTIGRFSSKTKLRKVYTSVLERIDNDNLKDALNSIGEDNYFAYKVLSQNASYLSVQGHSEIAKQSIVTLNNLLVDANIGGIPLREDATVKTAIKDTSELIGSLLKEEQSGIQSNIDTYLNVVGSIKNDLVQKKAVFSETTMTSNEEDDKK